MVHKGGMHGTGSRERKTIIDDPSPDVRYIIRVGNFSDSGGRSASRFRWDGTQYSNRCPCFFFFFCLQHKILFVFPKKIKKTSKYRAKFAGS